MNHNLKEQSEMSLRTRILRSLDLDNNPQTKTKTVAVTFQLRVPKKMRTREIVDYVRSAINSERGHYHPEENSFSVDLYRDRVEVFMP